MITSLASNGSRHIGQSKSKFCSSSATVPTILLVLSLKGITDVLQLFNTFCIYGG